MNKDNRTIIVLTISALLLIIFVLSRSLRINLDYVHLDEAFSWKLIQYSLPEVLKRAAEDVHPPLYYLLLKAWSSVFGISMFSLRSISVVFGFATAPLLLFTVREACSYARENVGSSYISNYNGPLLSAGLVVFHTSQIHASRDARMYSMGVFFTVLTSWLLLKALRSSKSGMKWWIAYGFAIAAFCYTHNYAFFTLFGQTLFVLGDTIWRVFRESREHALRQAQDYLMAILIAIALYSPWIPDLFHQIQEVRIGYWIPTVTLTEVIQVLTSWGGGATALSWNGGADYVANTESYVWLVTLIGLTVFTFWKRNRAMWFFFLQASVPWVFSLAISIYGDRPIFMERYMVFSQVALLGLWGAVFENIGNYTFRLLLVCFLALTVGYNGVANIVQLPKSPPSAVNAMSYLKKEYKQGDVILADWVKVVNQLRYYSAEVGLSPVNVRVIQDRVRYPGHKVHIASLDEDDFIWSDQWPSNKYNRIWHVQDVYVPGTIELPDGMELIERRDFRNKKYSGPDIRDYSVVLYGKKRTHP